MMFRQPPADMKMEWPEAIEKTAEEARDLVLSECPDVKIQILGENEPATMDYRIDRVRIITGSNKKVLFARRG